MKLDAAHEAQAWCRRVSALEHAIAFARFIDAGCIGGVCVLQALALALALK